MFEPAIIDTVIAIPAAHGAIALVDMASGELNHDLRILKMLVAKVESAESELSDLSVA